MSDRETSRAVAAVVAGVCLIGLALIAAAVAGYAMALAYPRVFAAVGWVLVALLVIGAARELNTRFYYWRLWRRVDARVKREVQAEMDRRASRRGVPS